MSSNDHPKVEAPPALPAITATEEDKKTTTKEKAAKPLTRNPDDTYVYKDYASVSPESLDTNTTCHKKVPPACLQAQKLPSKMAVMLVDPDLMHVISWLPHGRSWKIYNRDIFTENVLPRYFGHKNYASFVRIVNAWGFRRVTSGLDRDSYYHELFLRGKPELHQRMKRLPSTHKKTPVSKEVKVPDFYEMAKISPLPEVTLSKPAPTMYNGSVHPNSTFLPSAAAVGGAAAGSAESAEGENADSKDEKQDGTSVLLENLRLSNELLKRQLRALENGMSLAGYPRDAAEAQARMNHQLMAIQRERYQQALSEEKDKQKKEDTSKTGNDDAKPAESNASEGDVKEEEGKEEEPDAKEGDKKEGSKVSSKVKDLIDRYNKKK